MSKFNVGDRVRIIGCHMYDKHVGKVAEVVGHAVDPPTNILSVLVDLPPCNPINERPYAMFNPNHLEKIGDDFEPSTWEAVEKWTKWNPTKVTA